MKPTLPILHESRRDDRATRFSRSASPHTDYNFQASAPTDFGHCCGTTSRPSFRRISESYFKNEAPVNFIAELALFGVIAVTALVPMLSSARALAGLLRSIGAL